jgi:hypothetical protein
VPASLTFTCPCECHGSSRPCNIEGGCGHLHPGCGVCSAPTGDTGRLCRTHTDGLRIDLADVPDLVAELEITRTRQNRTSAEKHGARSTTRPLPWNEHTAQKAFELNATLNAWALDVSKLGEDERDRLAPVHHTDTAEVARWIARNLSTLRMHTEAGTAHEEITDAIHQARRSIDKPLDKTFAGPCNEALADDTNCREDLYGYPGRRHATCGNCGAVHDMATRRDWMLSVIEDQVAHSGLLAGLVTNLGVPIASSTIRKYASAGRIKVISVDDQRRRLYRIGDVLDVFLKRAA